MADEEHEQEEEPQATVLSAREAMSLLSQADEGEQDEAEEEPPVST